MSRIEITKVSNIIEKRLPIFQEIGKRIEAVKRRAFELFERRGRGGGRELEDWLTAEREIYGWPAAEFSQQDGLYQMQVALPGFEVKDVQVTATPAEVIVHAFAAEERSGEKKGNLLWSEFSSNDVYRRFEMPDPINVDKVAAKLEKGVLRITAPAAAESKTISVAA